MNRPLEAFMQRGCTINWLAFNYEFTLLIFYLAYIPLVSCYAVNIKLFKHLRMLYTCMLLSS
jgi:hypothetical protein